LHIAESTCYLRLHIEKKEDMSSLKTLLETGAALPAA